MVLYYIKHCNLYGKPPRDLIDNNVRSDYGKLRYLVYTNHKLNGNFEILRNLAGGESVSTASIVQDFSAFNLVNEENFKSLLFFQGLVSFEHSNSLQCKLRIPNETIKRIDMDYLKDSLEYENVFQLNTERLGEKLADFALNGTLDVFEYIAENIKNNTGIRDYIHNETAVKSMYLTYLSMTPYMVIRSEAELNKGFADILLKPLHPLVEVVGIVELKYFPRREGKAPTDKEIEKAVAEASEQLEKYQDDIEVTRWTDKGRKLVKVVIVFHGWELVKIVNTAFLSN